MHQDFLTTVQIVGYQLYTKKGVTWKSVEPWERMMNRKYRMFQADVQVHAPKDRTLMNYRFDQLLKKKSKKNIKRQGRLAKTLRVSRAGKNFQRISPRK